LDSAVDAECGERTYERCFHDHKGDHLPALVAEARADEGKDQAGGDGAERNEFGVEALDYFVGAGVEELGLPRPNYV